MRVPLRVDRARGRTAFFIEKKTGTNRGKKRTLKSCLGQLKISKKQAEALGIEPRTRHSPLLEKCCFLLSANESYQNAENDMNGLNWNESRSFNLSEKSCEKRL